MKRKFITNLAFLLFLNLLVKPLYAFGIDVGVQNAVGEESYGNYFILFSFSVIFQILLDLGIDNFNRRELARQGDVFDVYFRHMVPLKVLLATGYFLLCSITGYALGWRAGEFGLLLLLLLNQILSGFVQYARSNLGGLHHFRPDSILSVLDKVIVIVACGLILLHPVGRMHFRIEWFVYAQTCAYLIVTGVAFAMMFARVKNLRFSFNIPFYVSILKRSLPYALLVLLMAAYTRSGSVLLGILHRNGSQLAGIYAQSFRLIEILSNYGYLFTIILLPMFSRMINDGERTAQLTQLSSRLLLVPSVIAACACFFYRYEIIDLLYFEHAAISSGVFGILIFSFLGMCVTYIFGTLLTAHGNLGMLNAMAAIALAINVLLNLLLIRKSGVMGAAVASLITQLFASLFQVVLAVRIFHLKPNVTLLAGMAVFSAVVFFSGWLFHRLDISWILSLSLYVLVSLSLSLTARLIDLGSLKRILLESER